MSTLLRTDLPRRPAARLIQKEADHGGLRAIIEAAVDGIVSADAHSIITQVNRAALRMFGYTDGELLGRPLTVLMPERYHAAHYAGVERFLRTGEARVIGRTVELVGLRKNGDEFPVELSLAALPAGDGSAFAGILRDITGCEVYAPAHPTALRRDRRLVAAWRNNLHVASARVP